MARIFNCDDRLELLDGMRQARAAIARGELVLMPTDTVYGVAADAFSPAAVAALLAAKGRGREAPPPVLVADLAVVDALASVVPDEVSALLERFAPGPLTVILPARDSLRWDLGDTRGTVALRIPNHDIARELLRETGPLAVSSANRHGEPAATTAAEADAALGDRVGIVLDAGDASGEPSTIIDATGLASNDRRPARIVRQGALARSEIEAVLGDLLAPDLDAENDAG